ncbi:hypothetical protein ABIB40_004014 [Pedobacter sp. UYP30]|uniref:hypothetical protein n=1 Tax=Pedobacter sp. UYP30 TaxID=1756400 RepID=UPI0033985448
MEEVFIEHLDQIYWQGYGMGLREDNPEDFYKQLGEFTDTYKIPKYETSKPLSNGAIRPSRHSINSREGGNTNDLFAT